MIEVRKKSIIELVKAIDQFPSRYIGFGSIPIGLDYDTTMQYVENNINRKQLAGMGEFTPGSGQIYLLENVFKASSEFGNLATWVQ